MDVQNPACELQEAAGVGRRYRGPKRVLIVVNTDSHFLSHRATWGVALQAAGAEVTVIAQDTGKSDAIRSLGFSFLNVTIGRETSSGFRTMATSASRVFFAMLRMRPNVVFLVHQVAYTVGWPAALLLPRTKFIRVLGGLGRALDPTVLQTRAGRIVRISGYLAGRLANVFTLFQVEYDRQTFARLGLLPRPERSLVISGTGIELRAWNLEDRRDFGNPVVLFASRLFREKGVYEFVEAARMLRGRGWRFQVAGVPDAGVESAVPANQLEEWRYEQVVDLLGYRTDMARVLGGATLLVFPTRHPEGTPRVLIEAGASGIPAIVSGHPGCAAVVQDGISGIVLSDHPSADEVAAAIETLASNPPLAKAMGDAARERISAAFSLEAVITQLLEWQAVGAIHL